MKKRVISGIIAIILLIVALLLRETIVFNIIIAAALVLAMMESQVTTKVVKNSNYVILSVVYAVASAFFPKFGFYPSGLLITALYILGVILLVIFNNNNDNLLQVFYSVGITMLITLGLNSVSYINYLYVSKSYMYTSSDSLFLLLVVFAGAWFGDTGAYFIGSNFGKHKICPAISPKKSLEGVIGGVVSTVVGVIIIGLIWNFAILDDKAYVQFGWLILVAAICPIIGLIGDLFFSCIKRHCQLKDYGKIMPGHGGVLDRVDSLILVAPFVSIVLMFLPLIVRK